MAYGHRSYRTSVLWLYSMASGRSCFHNKPETASQKYWYGGLALCIVFCVTRYLLILLLSHGFSVSSVSTCSYRENAECPFSGLSQRVTLSVRVEKRAVRRVNRQQTFLYHGTTSLPPSLGTCASTLRAYHQAPYPSGRRFFACRTHLITYPAQRSAQGS